MITSVEKLILKRPQWKNSKMYLGRARKKIDPWVYCLNELMIQMSEMQKKKIKRILAKL